MISGASFFANSEENTNEKGFKYRSFILSWFRQYYITVGVAVLVLIGAVWLLVLSSKPSQVIVPVDASPVVSRKSLRDHLVGIETTSLVFPDQKPVEPEEPEGLHGAPWEGCEYSLPNPDTRNHIVEPPKGPITLVCCNTTKVISVSTYLLMILIFLCLLLFVFANSFSVAVSLPLFSQHFIYCISRVL
jgi:hypothetical protein